MSTQKIGTGAVDNYLNKLTPEQRNVLETVRQQIKSLAPDAQEVISYQMPTFRYCGRALVGISAWKNHYSLYPYNSLLIKLFKNELSGFETAAGTIRFTANKPLPKTLLNKLIKQRIKENESRAKKNNKK